MVRWCVLALALLVGGQRAIAQESECPRKYQDVTTPAPPVVTPGIPAPPLESGPDKGTVAICLCVAAALGLHREWRKKK